MVIIPEKKREKLIKVNLQGFCKKHNPKKAKISSRGNYLALATAYSYVNRKAYNFNKKK